jgi:hypothetical protein
MRCYTCALWYLLMGLNMSFTRLYHFSCTVISFSVVFCLIVASMLQVLKAARKSMDALAKFSTQYAHKALDMLMTWWMMTQKQLDYRLCRHYFIWRQMNVWMCRRRTCIWYILPSAISIYELALWHFLLHYTAFCFSLQINMVSSILAYSFGCSLAWITSISVAIKSWEGCKTWAHAWRYFF